MVNIHDIPVSFHFSVDFGLGEAVGDHRFQEVAGLGAEVTTEELKEGGADVTYRLPSGLRFSNLILKRGLISDSKVLEWCRDAIEQFKFRRTNVEVVLLNDNHEPLASWKFIDAWPVKWSVSDFKAQDNSLVIESIELAYRIMRKM
jgi:phage tail-like protein